MSGKLRVLIICQHNSSQSQMAEAYFNQLQGAHIYAESAGIEPAQIVNPFVVEVMKEEGIDFSNRCPQSVYDLIEKGRIFDHIITFCDKTELNYPIIPGVTKRWHVTFPDISNVIGTHEEQLTHVRSIRDMIRYWIENHFTDNFVSKTWSYEYENLPSQTRTI